MPDALPADAPFGRAPIQPEAEPDLFPVGRPVTPRPLVGERPRRDIRYIAIEGVIGAGKTSLAGLLATRLGAARVVMEEFEENPFLARFYAEPERYAFPTQMAFLMSRYRQQQVLHNFDLFQEYLITDYIFDKDRIFAVLNLAADELKLYDVIATAIERTVPVPDLVIYLQSSTDRLMRNIHQRARTYEEQMSPEYLNALNESYNYFFFRYGKAPVLIVNATEIDFVHNPAHFTDLVEQILRPHSGGVAYYNPPSAADLKVG